MRMYEVPLNSTITNYSEIDDSWVEITEISSYYNMFKLIISNKYHNATTIKLQNVGD